MSWVVEAGLVAKAGLTSLAMMAAQGTVLALLALAITRSLGARRPSWQAAIWLVVAIKFALPWGPAMPWSLSDLVASFADSSAPVAPLVVSDALVRVTPTVTMWPAAGWLALATLWAAGALFVLARATLAQLRTSRAARAATPASGDVQDLLAQLARQHRSFILRAPRVSIGSPDVGPHVVGVLRPIIVVPPALLERIEDPALLRAALLHELGHVRRLDALARLIQIAASALMWWWPVIRLVHRRLELAREAACDAWALSAGTVSRPAYARLLVRMAQLRTTAAPALAAQHSLDARVAAVLGPAANRRTGYLHHLALVGWIALALGGARTAKARGAAEVCQYTPQLAEALMTRFPQADLDGDGLLSKDEACDLQAELRRVPAEERLSRLSPEAESQFQTLLAEPLCCNCTEAAYPSPETTTCQKQ